MSDEKSHKVNVWAVFAWLLVITILEVGLVYMHLEKKLLVVLLIGSALLKAALVAVYFMHLKFEGKVIWTMLVGALILGAIFLLALFPDMVFSNLK